MDLAGGLAEVRRGARGSGPGFGELEELEVVVEEQVRADRRDPSHAERHDEPDNRHPWTPALVVLPLVVGDKSRAEQTLSLIHI